MTDLLVGPAAASVAGSPRWRGQPGRLEVWYATATDEASGTGLWAHYEVVSPLSGPARAHGWGAVFEPGRPPVVERFGPASCEPSGAAAEWFSAAGAMVKPTGLVGSTGRLGWELTWDQAGPPLFTFPRWAWAREVLPGAQVVVTPGARMDGAVEVDGRRLEVSGPGALAHIYGHGNAERWAWLHADLGGGDVLEVVTAVSRRPGLRRLPPLAFVRLRRDGVDWPRDPLVAAPLFRTRLGLPDWRLTGTVGRRRLRVDVHVPPEASVALDYEDPDGAPAVCTNSERADAEVMLDRWSRGWAPDQRWILDGTAHAEVGLRPDPERDGARP